MRFAQIDKAGNIVVFLDGKAGDFPDLEKAGVLKQVTAQVTREWTWTGSAFVAPVAKQPAPDPLREMIREIVREELAKAAGAKI